MLQEPLPHIKAHPSPTNLLDWHYALEGVKGTVFEGGVYHGCVLGPSDAPLLLKRLKAARAEAMTGPAAGRSCSQRSTPTGRPAS